MSIEKILIANRGEIAERIIKTCKERGIISCATFSDADKNSRYTKLADEAVHIGSNDLKDSYLNIDKIIQIAKQQKADAIHPGFGFLSENANFALQCEKNNIIFIGPSAEAIEKMGSKKTAKEIIQKINVPSVPGYNGKDQKPETLAAEAKKIVYPVLLKAAMGGGGKGMRVVNNEKEFATSLESAKREALNAFGDDTILLEKFFTSVRHIEVQIIGDKHGNHLHLFERECSIQRRHQKIIEEAPSKAVTPELRKKITDSALKIAKELNYYSLGTIEFIVDEKLDYYFLEVNTRIQVEHPVTEMITGLDLVSLQIDIAEGKALGLKQEDIKMNGHSIECRLYAENPSNNFLPETGKLLTWIEPKNARVDSGVQQGDEISVFFDPMLAKLIVHGADRDEAIRKMCFALKNMHINGLKNNKAFLISILENENFKVGKINTNFIANEYAGGFSSPPSKGGAGVVESIHQQLIAACVFSWLNRQKKQKALKGLPSGWRNNRSQWQSEKYVFGNEEFELKYVFQNGDIDIEIKDKKYQVNNFTPPTPSLREGASMGKNSPLKGELEGAATISYICNGIRSTFIIDNVNTKYFVSSFEHRSNELTLKPKFEITTGTQSKGDYISPMPGEVIKILVSEGTQVKAGDALLIMVSMKMENTIEAHSDGIINEIFVKEKTFVEGETLLLTMKNKYMPLRHKDTK